jgi:hypothetical protein
LLPRHLRARFDDDPYAPRFVGDVFASFLMLRKRPLVLATRVLSRWLGWIAVVAGPFFFLQSFGICGGVSSFGLTLDLIGFLLFLIFVLASSVIGPGGGCSRGGIPSRERNPCLCGAGALRGCRRR